MTTHCGITELQETLEDLFRRFGSLSLVDYMSPPEKGPQPAPSIIASSALLTDSGSLPDIDTQSTTGAAFQLSSPMAVSAPSGTTTDSPSLLTDESTERFFNTNSSPDTNTDTDTETNTERSTSSTYEADYKSSPEPSPTENPIHKISQEHPHDPKTKDPKSTSKKDEARPTPDQKQIMNQPNKNHTAAARTAPSPLAFLTHGIQTPTVLPTTPCALCNQHFFWRAETVLVIECGHMFHERCLRQWLEYFRGCRECGRKLYLG